MVEAAKLYVTTQASLDEFESIPLEDRGLAASTYEIIARTAIKYPNRTALSFLLQGTLEEEAVRFTYREFLNKINQTANAFYELGVGKDDCVSMMLPNLPQTHFTIWGAEAAGIFNPVNPLLEIEHIAAILNEANTKVLVTLAPFPGTELWDKAKQLKALVPSLEKIVTVDLGNFLPQEFANSISAEREDYLSDDVLDFDTYIKAFSADKLVSGRVIQPSDIASYFHTGGTTGTPKLAPHTHANEVTMSWQINTMVDSQETDVSLCGLPLFHVNAVMATGLSIFEAGTEVLLATPQGYRTPALIENFWTLVERYKISFFSSVPTVLTALLDHSTEGHDLSSLRFALCGAAPLAKELANTFEGKTGLRLIEGYGQTEGTCASSCTPLFGEPQIGSIGLRMPYTQVRIVNVDETGKFISECATNEIGVLAISGATVFKGYKQASQNAGIWIEDGWLNTGDLGRIDENGYMWLTGRSKDLIIRGGHNIDPLVIEDALYKHPAVAEAAAIGKPDPVAGELPVAYIQLKENCESTEGELLEFAAKNISERAAIPKNIFIINEIPTTAIGKIFKPDLRCDVTKRTISNALNDTLLNNMIRNIKVENCKNRGLFVTISTNESQLARMKDVVKTSLSGFTFDIDVVAI